MVLKDFQLGTTDCPVICVCSAKTRTLGRLAVYKLANGARMPRGGGGAGDGMVAGGWLSYVTALCDCRRVQMVLGICGEL